MRDDRSQNRWRPVLPALVLLVSPQAAAQPPAEVHVRYTEARTHSLRGEVRLPGTVESRTTAVVAGEVAGKVAEVAVREGDRVKEGEILIRLRPNWYQLQHREAVGRLEESQARLALANSRLERARELFEADVVSQQELDDAISEYTAWQGRENQNQAQVDQFALTLELLRVRAPFDGVVTRKLTEVGQWIVSGGAVAEMVSLDRLEVRVDVPERYFEGLRTGDPAEVSFAALANPTVTGRVERIVPRAEEQTRTFPVKISLPTKHGRIAVGMLATVALPVGEPLVSTIVPKDAVVRDGAVESVYRITADGSAELVNVTTGAGAGAWIAVSGPIRPGDKVIVRGNERLEPGQRVRALEQEYAEP